MSLFNEGIVDDIFIDHQSSHVYLVLEISEHFEVDVWLHRGVVEGR